MFDVLNNYLHFDEHNAGDGNTCQTQLSSNWF